MTTDKELLELAAKAVGLELQWHKSALTGEALPSPTHYTPGCGHVYWSPLDDDGEALRLLNRLPFHTLYVSEIGATVFIPHEPNTVGLKCDEYASEHGGNLDAATRRAITRAAAEIGKEMP